MTQTTTPVDLRVAARAFLAAAGPLAIHKAALDAIVEIALAGAPITSLEDETERLLAFGRSDGEGHGRLNVQAGVAVIPLKGVLTPNPSFLSILFGGSSGGLLGFRSDLREAIGHSDVEAIVLDVNSPGGSVSLIEETTDEFAAAIADSGKEVVAVANTMMGSAAYQIASQAGELVASPSSFVGSIGTYVMHQDWSAANEQMGVRPTYISAGRFKVEGNMHEPLGDAARAAIQSEVDDFYSVFVAQVARGRGATSEEVRAGYGEGRVLTAHRAVEAGLADRVATLDQVIAELAGRGRGAGGRGRASGAGRNMTANADSPGPNATPVAEEVQARIAAVRGLTPPVSTPGGNTA